MLGDAVFRDVMSQYEVFLKARDKHSSDAGDPPAEPDSGAGLMTEESTTEFYCPHCQQPVSDPLLCGDCASLICRRCGTPLERVDELGIG